jgi:hypothetical protein
MGDPRQLRQIALFSALALTAGCSQPSIRGDAHESSAQISRTEREANSSPSSGRRLPFAAVHDLPAGTLMVVRLEKSISTKGGATSTFVAVIDKPVTLEGNTVVPRGAIVQGQVEGGLAPKGARDAGYVRLNLESINVDGTEVPILTSTLFARGSPPRRNSSSSVGFGQPGANKIFMKSGRQLTFRLSAPASIRVPAAERDDLSLVSPR